MDIFYYELIQRIDEELYENTNIKINQIETSSKSSKKNLLKITDFEEKSMNAFYSTYGEFLLEWSDNKLNSQGNINILKVDNLLGNRKDLVYFDHTPEDSPLRDFHIVDFFIDEACVGIYKNHPELPGMHFYEFENETYPLHVDFEGYMKLLAETKGFFYWQTVILDYLKGTNTPSSQNFKENMPKLFNDFNHDKFIELYESIRIDK